MFYSCLSLNICLLVSGCLCVCFIHVCMLVCVLCFPPTIAQDNSLCIRNREISLTSEGFEIHVIELILLAIESNLLINLLLFNNAHQSPLGNSSHL